MNKSVTLVKRGLLFALLIGLMMVIIGGCRRTAAEPNTVAEPGMELTSAPDTRNQPVAIDRVATAAQTIVPLSSTPTNQSSTPGLAASTATTATATIRPMNQPPRQFTATLIESQSPLPTPPATAPAALLPVALPTVDATIDAPFDTSFVLSPSVSSSLSSSVSMTAEIQAQMTLSMAVAARTLLQILQQPVTPESAVATPIATLEPFTELADLLTTTVAPPLPTDQIGLTLPPTPVGEQPILPPIANPLDTLSLQPDGTVRSAQVPILMYHYLSTPPDNADIYRRDLSVSPALFAAHLDRMLAEGYTVISLYDLIAHLTQGAPLPPKPVVITFDDGYRDNYEYAFPLLRERNLSATFFIVMEFINQARPEYLTWEMVSEMAAGGMDFEVHGVDHTTLRGRSRVDLEFQALRSYETIRNLLNYQPRFVSYPAGEYDQQTIEVFRSAGYWAGFTTVQGATHSSDRLFELQRVRVRGTTTPDELANLLALDW